MQALLSKIRKLFKSKAAWLALLLLLVCFFAYLGYSSNKYAHSGTTTLQRQSGTSSGIQ